MLHVLTKQTKGAFKFGLFKGDSKRVLPEVRHSTCEYGRLDRSDFAFIDGGHSLETIRSDIDCLLGCRVLLLDDYYEMDENGKCPDLEKHGVNRVLEELGRSYQILPVADRVKGGGFVRMVVL